MTNGMRPGGMLVIWVATSLISPAAAASLEHFKGSVKVDRSWSNKAAEGMVTSGVQVTDADGTYTIICKSATNRGQPQPASISSWKTAEIWETNRSPNHYLQRVGSTPRLLLQWAEACAKLM
ncbi:MAG: hypothetical protein IH582_02565 [Afipia sp.]|nr:hypothetical protein [Afipia sp.]